MDVPVYNMQGAEVGSFTIDEASLGGTVNHALLKQAFVRYHANRRQGSARTKNRSLVEGSTRKLYRQKGTGRARMGMARTPTRRGGGVTFAKTLHVRFELQSTTIDEDVLNARDDAGVDAMLLELQYRFGAGKAAAIEPSAPPTATP